MELGNFTEEKNIYKNAARRGQCLSSTTFITMLNKEKIILFAKRQDVYIF